MKQSDQERLLNNILADDELSAFRKASLDRGLVALRRQRTQRLVLRSCAMAVLLLLVAVVLLFQWKGAGSGQLMVASNSVRTASSPPASEANPVRKISDEELFALFPDRSVALIGKPGEQQLVFLDQN